MSKEVVLFNMKILLSYGFLLNIFPIYSRVNIFWSCLLFHFILKKIAEFTFHQHGGMENAKARF